MPKTLIVLIVVSASKKPALAGTAALLGLVLIAVVTMQTRGQREPRYQGRRLHSWLRELDPVAPNSRELAPLAARAVKAIGTNALPSLARMLRTEEPLWKRAALAFNARQSLVQLPVVPAEVIRAEAVDGYAVLGPAAEPAVRSLIEMMESKSSAQVRACVAAALAGIGPPAHAALPALFKASQDPDPEVGKNALFAIRNIQMWAPERLIWERRW